VKTSIRDVSYMVQAPQTWCSASVFAALVLSLFCSVSLSSREDQECRGERPAAHVAEIPTVLLALPAEHGK
jgi:hypothetical protein